MLFESEESTTQFQLSANNDSRRWSYNKRYFRNSGGYNGGNSGHPTDHDNACPRGKVCRRWHDHCVVDYKVYTRQHNVCAALFANASVLRFFSRATVYSINVKGDYKRSSWKLPWSSCGANSTERTLDLLTLSAIANHKHRWEVHR
jgi:hypothetical protein